MYSILYVRTRFRPTRDEPRASDANVTMMELLFPSSIPLLEVEDAQAGISESNKKTER
jgi:hypothetical protein